MANRQSGAVKILVLAGLMAMFAVFGLGTLVLLDRAMLKNTMSKRDSSSAYNAPSKSTTSPGGNINFDVLQNGLGNPLAAAREASRLTEQDITAGNARAVLRSASGEIIQSAIAAKTGRTVGLDKIEKGRKKALSSDGQRKIEEAMKRRGEVDINKIRSKLNY